MTLRVYFRSMLLLWVLLGGTAASALTGVPTWQQRWSGSSSSAPYPFVGRELADGSSMVVAYSSISLTAIRYDGDGNQLSAANFDLPYFSPIDSNYPNLHFATIAAVDPFGGIFVASVSDVSLNRGDIWLNKYDGVSGRALWPAPVVFDGANHPQERALKLVVDAAGNVIVAAQSRRSNLINTVVLKYDGVSGALLWGPTTLGSSPTGAAVDPSGDVFVITAGSTYKINGLTGAVAWGPVKFGEPSDPANATSLALTPDGGVVVVGFNYGVNIEAFKYDGATGAVLWGPAIYTETPSGNPVATGVDVGPTGDVFLSGFIGDQYLILAYSSRDGSLLWGPAKTPASSARAPLSIGFTGHGDVVASGWNPASHLSLWLSRGADGSLLWGPNADPQSSSDLNRRPLMIVGSNGRIVTAATHLDGTVVSLTTTGRDAAAGSVDWSTAFQGTSPAQAVLQDITQGPDGSVIVTGYTYDPYDSHPKFVTFKYARPDGAILWGPVYYDVPAGYFGYPYLVRTDSAGDVFVLGAANGTVVLKYNGTTGALLWSSPHTDVFPTFLAVDTSGDVYVLAQKSKGYESDFATLKISGSTGQTLWGPIPFDGGPGSDDYPKFLAVTPGGDVVVTGSSFPGSYVELPRWVTLKYSGSTGAVLWGPVTFSQSGGGSNFVGDLAIDANGDVFVTGQSSDGNDYLMVTLKYAGTSGAVLWGPKTGGGPGLTYGAGTSLALNATGDVIIGGTLYPPDLVANFATVKYRGSDGELLWGPRLSAVAGNDNNLSNELALDSDGNPIIAGNTRNPQRNDDIALVKYDGATGAPLWGPLVVGGPGDDRLPIHNIVARGKSVVVAGTSSKQFLTLAFDEAFGIATRAEDLPPGYCGRPFAWTLTAPNAAGSINWSIVSGALPPGLELDASSGQISGSPTGVGTFSFRVRAQDFAGPSAYRDFVISVSEGSAFVPILATANPVCLGQNTTLSVSGSWSAYLWLPGGQTSPTISVSPSDRTDYAVLLTDGKGCRTRGSVRISIRSRTATVKGPRCMSGGGQGTATTEDGGPGAAYEWTIVNGAITAGAGTRSVAFVAGNSGAVTLSVKTTAADGCEAESGEFVAPIGCATEPEGLAVDPASNSGLSDGNGILEPGETVVVSPAWKNQSGGALPLTGTATGLSGPAGAAYMVGDSSADYGSISDGGTTDCRTATGDCYAMSVSVPASRPATHWDAKFTESLSNADPAKVWTVHVGQSFTDVPKTHVFYPFVERLLHNGVTTGCAPETYCPEDSVSRLQMAIFLARAQAGGDGNVQSSGTAQGNPFDCRSGGVSLFSDIAADNPFCRHVHAIYAAGITTGCEPGKYCPDPNVTRAQIAMFIARAIAGSDAAVPLSYGPDPVTGRSYSCDAGSPNLHFTDVTTSDIFCRHTHSLWAKDVISGFPDNSYQPGLNVTRGAMAKFLSNGFALRLYGP